MTTSDADSPILYPHIEDAISVNIEIGDGPGQVTREEWETMKAIWGIEEAKPTHD